MAAADLTSVLYDTVPYPGRPFAQTHPGRLATLARLYGLQPAAPSACTALEIGCGDGGNLLPMAHALPQARFVGIDISGRAIAVASARAQRLGLENVRFEERSFAGFEPDPGSFDYVIAHGVYSWVEGPLRDALLALCARVLSEHGVAYVSYNTLPGGRLWEILRELVRAHVDDADDPAQQLAKTRELLAVLRAAWTFNEQLKTLVDLATKMIEDTDALLFHDTLAPVNERLWFGEFVEHAGRHGLQFLSEANFWEMQVGWLPHELRTGMLASEDRLVREQMLDQLRMRMFRQTLLCHAAQELDDSPQPERLEALCVSVQAQASEPDDEGRVTFMGINGAKLTTDHAPVIGALQRVTASWPSILPIAELWPPDAPAQERQLVCDALLRCYSAALAGLHAEPAAFDSSAATMPRVSPVARLQAREGAIVANLRHEPTELDEPARVLVTLLDGTRDRAALLAAVGDALEGTVDRAELSTWLERSLEELARCALLVPS